MPKKRKKDQDNDSNSHLIELERSMRLTGRVENDDDEFATQSDFVFDFSETTVRRINPVDVDANFRLRLSTKTMISGVQRQ